VEKYWSYAAYHSAWPESVDYSIYTNNSCVPPGVAGYTEGRGCSIGALPQYIVNATTEEQVAKAMRWASERDIRIVVKGTGHDLSGRYASLVIPGALSTNLKLVQIYRRILAIDLDTQLQACRTSAFMACACL
jgi:FAD/FMN-containing dehydrogenase